MPTYEYACPACDSKHEIVQAMTDPTLTDCPDCGQPTLRKLFSGVGVVFKGSGFYRTDSRDKSAKSSSSTTASSTSTSSGSGSGGSGSSGSGSSSSSSTSTSSPAAASAS